jgi:hypothetical protein
VITTTYSHHPAPGPLQPERVDVGIRKPGPPALVLTRNGQRVTDRVERDVAASLRQRDALPLATVFVHVKDRHEPNAATLAAWIVRAAAGSLAPLAAGRFDLGMRIGSDAMRTGADVANALRLVADRLEYEPHEGTIPDLNGNTVGSYGYRAD